MSFNPFKNMARNQQLVSGVRDDALTGLQAKKEGQTIQQADAKARDVAGASGRALAGQLAGAQMALGQNASTADKNAALQAALSDNVKQTYAGAAPQLQAAAQAQDQLNLAAAQQASDDIREDRKWQMEQIQKMAESASDIAFDEEKMDQVAQLAGAAI